MINFSIYRNVPSIPISNLSKYHLSDNFPTYNIRLEPEKKVELEIKETPKRFTKTDKLVISKPTKLSTSKTKANNNPSFMEVLDKMAKSDPTIAKNRDVLSKLAMVESSQRWNARNGRAYGAFLLMDFNIKGDVNDFLNNPEELIRLANRLLESNKKLITDNDLKLAKEQGYTYNSLLGGSWLGGIGGMRKVLTNTGNPSDKDGADVKSRMLKFRFDTGGEIPNPAYPRFQINNWLDNWNKARLNTGNFDDLLGNGLLEQQKLNRDNTPIFYDSLTRDEELGITNPFLSRSLNSNIGLNSDGASISVTPGFYYKGNLSLSPFIQILTSEARDILNQNYNNKLTTLLNRFDREDIEWLKLQANKTLVDNAFSGLSDFDSTLLHEQSHASIATPQENRIDLIITNKLDNYLDSPTEIYSRLNLLRKYYNFDPNKLWDKKNIRELKRKNGPTFNILDRYSDEELIRLFNEVADNSSIPSDLYTIYAKGGVKLTKELLEYINRLLKNLPLLKADNRTKELKEALNRDSKNKRIGNTIKEAALNTAEGITSAVYPIAGAGLAVKNAFTNPTGAYIDVASMVIPYSKNLIKPLSNSKNIGKGISSKYTPDPVELTDDLIKELNEAVLKANEDINMLFNNSTNLKNVNIKDKLFSLHLNPEIKKRADNINWGKTHNINRLKLNDSESYIYDKDSKNNFNTKPGWEDIYNYREEQMNRNNWRAANWVNNQDVKYGDTEIHYSRYNFDGSLKSPKQLYDEAIHENIHKMLGLYNIDYDNNNEISNIIRKYINTDKTLSESYKKWVNNINEHHGELWRYRIKHNIGERDLTKDELKLFIKENSDLYQNEIIDNPPDELLDALAKLASIQLITKSNES